MTDDVTTRVADWLSNEGIRIRRKAFTDEEHDMAHCLIDAGEYLRQHRSDIATAVEVMRARELLTSFHSHIKRSNDPGDWAFVTGELSVALQAVLDLLGGDTSSNPP